MNSRWIDSTRRTAGMVAVAGAVLALQACTTMGTGTGSLSPDNTPLTLAWTSKDGGRTGTLSATQDTGASFSGPFVQVDSTVTGGALVPIWNGWAPGWSDWNTPSTYYPTGAFPTRYSGRVVANLKGPDAQQMRCRFHLNEPARGMSGGGQGECQSSGGRTVNAVFARS